MNAHLKYQFQTTRFFTASLLAQIMTLEDSKPSKDRQPICSWHALYTGAKRINSLKQTQAPLRIHSTLFGPEEVCRNLKNRETYLNSRNNELERHMTLTF